MAFALFDKLKQPLEGLKGNMKFLSGPMEQAQGFYDAGDYGKALEQLEGMLKSQPNHMQAWFLKGLCYDRQDAYQDALEAFKQFLRQKPDDQEALYNTARQYLMLGMPDTALGYVEMMEMLSEEAKQDTDVLYLKASIFEDMAQPEEAVQAYQTLFLVDPDHRGKRFLGELYVSQGDLEQGVSVLQDYVMTHQDDEAEVYLALQMGKLGQWPEVVELCQTIVSKQPQNHEAFNQLGLAHFCLEQYEEAKESLNKALAINPNFDLALNNLGYTLMKLDEDKAALTAFETYVKMLEKGSDEYTEVEEQIGFLKDKIKNS